MPVEYFPCGHADVKQGFDIARESASRTRSDMHVLEDDILSSRRRSSRSRRTDAAADEITPSSGPARWAERGERMRAS